MLSCCGGGGGTQIGVGEGGAWRKEKRKGRTWMLNQIVYELSDPLIEKWRGAHLAGQKGASEQRGDGSLAHPAGSLIGGIGGSLLSLY